MKHFVIVGTQRTGSSALGEAIGTHPNIACGWEWTQKLYPHKIPQITKEVLFKQRFELLDTNNRIHMQKLIKKQPKLLGYRRLFRSSKYWAVKPEYSPVHYLERLQWHLKWFAKHEIYIIHIIRKNNLAWLKSKALSKKTGNYSKGQYDKEVTATIHPHEAVKRVRYKHWLDNQLKTLQNYIPYISIDYDQFLENNTYETKRVVRFLNENEQLLPELTKTMRLKPQSSQPVDKLVKNYHDIHELLSRYELLTYDN